MKGYFVPLPTESTAELPEANMDENVGKVFQQDLNQQPFADTDDFNDDELLLHQHWLWGEKKPNNFKLFEQNALPPVS